jgi:hypothetical protein
VLGFSGVECAEDPSLTSILLLTGLSALIEFLRLGCGLPISEPGGGDTIFAWDWDWDCELLRVRMREEVDAEAEAIPEARSPPAEEARLVMTGFLSLE